MCVWERERERERTEKMDVELEAKFLLLCFEEKEEKDFFGLFFDALFELTFATE